MTEAALVASFVSGAALVVAGVWLVAPAAGLIVAGLVLLLVPWWYVRGRRAAS